MAESNKYKPHGNIIGRIWGLLLVRRLAGLAGLAMIIVGYGMILNTSELSKTADLEAVTRHAVSGMAMVFCGGVVEALVLLAWVRR